MSEAIPKLPTGFIPVRSSNLRAIKWTKETEADLANPALGKLEVIFVNGTRYGYEAVPDKVYLELAAAPSVGRAFGELILKAKPKYECARLLAPTPEPVQGIEP